MPSYVCQPWGVAARALMAHMAQCCGVALQSSELLPLYTVFLIYIYIFFESLKYFLTSALYYITI